MKKSAIITNDRNTVSLLSVSPFGEDHSVLEAIFHRYSKFLTSPTVQRADNLLRNHRIPIAICERDLQPGSWQDLLERTVFMPHPPLIIVTSRLADERLWAEALNLGAWDVLAKPFDRTEVIRVVESAWRYWKDQHEASAGVPQTWRAAG